MIVLEEGKKVSLSLDELEHNGKDYTLPPIQFYDNTIAHFTIQDDENAVPLCPVDKGSWLIKFYCDDEKDKGFVILDAAHATDEEFTRSQEEDDLSYLPTCHFMTPQDALSTILLILNAEDDEDNSHEEEEK